MNNYYRQSIIGFGVVMPLCLMVGVICIALFASSKVSKDYKTKKKVYDKAMKEKEQVAVLQGRVGANGEILKQWNNIMERETRGTFVAHWKQAEGKFSGKELTRSSNNWVNFSEGLGKGNIQPASQVTMKFTGTYRAMQLALLEIESKLPQMQLDAMSMEPADDGERLNFVTTFTVWTGK